MFGRLTNFFKERRARKRLAPAIAPESISGLALELRNLAGLVSCMERGGAVAPDRLQLIQEEMDKVIGLCNWSEFNKLSTDTRLELRRSILNARKETLEDVTRHYPAVSTRMQ